MYLKNKYGWQMQAAELKQAMGLKPKQDWPFEGMGTKDIDGTKVYVLVQNPFKVKKHRAMAICPDCEKHVPAGRLQQHRKVHKTEIIK